MQSNKDLEESQQNGTKQLECDENASTNQLKITKLDQIISLQTSHAAKAWHFYHKVLGNPKYFCAPMVDASELAFRLLTRRYGVHVAFTPMIHSASFNSGVKFR